MSADKAIAAFDRNHERYEQDLMKFLRFVTISRNDENAKDMQACAGWIRDQLAAAGLHAEVVATGGHPAVFADSGWPVSPATGKPDTSAPTLLVYGHYDVQPIGDEKLWKSPAFEPTVRDGAIFARGSADDKGQVMCHVAAVRALYDAGLPVPVRLKFIIEGEEEIGSPNLSNILRERRDMLACDYVLISDTSKYDADTPSITQATRGIIAKILTVHGPDHDLHSGVFGGTVANPANAIARIIASFHDDQGRVTIRGFYDDVRVLSEEERRALRETDLTDAQLLAATGSIAPFGEPGYTTAERRGNRPTLDVNCLEGGAYSTIIPAKAAAKITMRLVPNQVPAKIAAAFDAHVQAVCPPGVRAETTSSQGSSAYVVPLDLPAIQIALKALAKTYGRPAVILQEGGTLPILPLFKEVLGAESIMLGFSDPNCNLHSPNEFFHLRDFQMGARCLLQFLHMMSPGACK
jgi:acetylornithine deacetylase/succinyl-diaminopimelate desuccinylase-like protein